jgi:Cd2+/Zn2+-exporting ATPase
VKLSRSTRAVINQNFLFGVFFIIGGLTLAAFGYVNAVVAAIMHNLGSLMVVFNSARLVRHGEELEPFQATARSETPGSAPQSPNPPARLQPQTV